jgi:hypothetical protein
MFPWRRGAGKQHLVHGPDPLLVTTSKCARATHDFK